MSSILKTVLTVLAITTMASAQSPTQNPADSFAPKIFQSADAAAGADLALMPYRILEPKIVQPGKKYPLVLVLHGVGERGNDNVSQLKHAAAEFSARRERFPAYVIFPQCPKSHRWVETDWTKAMGKGTIAKQPTAAMALALQLVDSIAQNAPIDPKRMYVCGLSMGGFGTWFAAAQSPKRFAAAVPVCGGGDPTWSGRYSGVAIWAHHGDADPVVPVERSREMIAALATRGHSPELRYSEYPDTKHDSWTRSFSNDELHRWLFSKSKP